MLFDRGYNINYAVMMHGRHLYEKSRARYQFGMDPNLNLNDWQSWVKVTCPYK